MRLPKLVITDIDGVWTDGGMYYDQTGNEWKKFNTSDSAGVLFLRYLEIPVLIMTGEDTHIVARRAEKLKINYLEQGVKNKLALAETYAQKLGIEMRDIAFIGDDINDMLLLSAVGFSACPANAPEYVKSRANLVLDVKGGDGAFRVFVEYILQQNGLMEKVLEMYLERSNLRQ
jgi:YrbI family 3-deoxy-D-manno-octulosonate 8-phosphate phosphatase